MKRLFSFLTIFTLFMFIELFNGENISMTSQDLTSTFANDALAAPDDKNSVKPTVNSPAVDPTTMILLGSGLIGLAGIGRKARTK